MQDHSANIKKYKCVYILATQMQIIRKQNNCKKK